MTTPESTTSDELEDGVEVSTFHLSRIDPTLLTSPVVLRSIGGIVIGLAVLTWPSRSDRILTRLMGLALLWVAIVGVRAALRARPTYWIGLITSMATAVLGAVLVARPDRSGLFVGRMIGLTLVAYGLHGAYKSLSAGTRPTFRLSLYGLAGAAGVVLIGFPEQVIDSFIAIGALGAIGVSILMLVISLDANTPGAATYEDTVVLVARWLRERPKSVDARQALYDKILYEGANKPTRVVRFFALMGFASVIASTGIVADSTAVVIGAMLVAPLMTPLMGMAISLVMGWPNRLTGSALIAVGGIIFAITVGLLVGLTSPAVIDTTSNAQILGRTSPTILDLVTAIAAGAAGAYGLSRPDVSDALPGVAIAISLVPPLAVVGIAYSQADWAAGNGALLLFATNMIAILLVGGVTFVLTGVTPLERITDRQHRGRTAVAATMTAAVLVLGALLLNGAEIADEAFRQSTVESTVDDWLQASEQHRFVSSEVRGESVLAVVIGPSTGLPPVQDLAERLAKALDRTIRVDVSLVIEERLTATGG